jgi:hypothetical protein
MRHMFQNRHASPEELIASGEGASFDLRGEYCELRPFVEEIKRAREAAGLTLDSPWPRCPGGVESTSRPSLAWKTGTSRTRRWTRSGATPPRSGGALS